MVPNLEPAVELGTEPRSPHCPFSTLTARPHALLQPGREARGADSLPCSKHETSQPGSGTRQPPDDVLTWLAGQRPRLRVQTLQIAVAALLVLLQRALLLVAPAAVVAFVGLADCGGGDWKK